MCKLACIERLGQFESAPAHHPISSKKALVLALGDYASKPSRQFRSRHRVALKDGGHLPVQRLFVGLGELFGVQDHDPDFARRLLAATPLDHLEPTQSWHNPTTP